MPRVTYIEHDGTRHRVEVPVGLSLMRGAIDNHVPGIRRLRRPMRLRHLPRLCRARLVRQGRRADYRFPGGEHVELCRRGRVQFAPGVPDRDARGI
jgi:hypothetical protein